MFPGLTGSVGQLATLIGMTDMTQPAPVAWLASAAAAGVTGERIVATEFSQWLAARRAAENHSRNRPG
jgi:hypothetical protein